MHQKKKCPKCKLDKPTSDFHTCGGRPCSYCKPCAIDNAKKHYRTKTDKEYAKAYANNKRKFLLGEVENVKAKYGCALCMEQEPCCLDFHHINDDKEISVAKLVTNKNIKRLIEEINKCAVLCSNCHRKVHRGVLSDKHLLTCHITLDDIRPYSVNAAQ